MSYFGIDVHLKTSAICEISEEGAVVERCEIPTTQERMRRFFADRTCRGIALEACAQSPWLNRLLSDLGHTVTIVNPIRFRLIAESSMKTDRADAEMLARMLRADPVLLKQSYGRSEEAQHLRSRIRVRRALVCSRRSAINTVRGVLRSHGFRLVGSTPARVVVRYAEMELPAQLRQILDPLVEFLLDTSQRLALLNKEMKTLAQSDPITRRLQTVPGVGPQISLAFRACIDDPGRFRRRQDVGAYLGLRPSQRASAGRERRGGITREGDRDLRSMLVQGAHTLMARGPDCDLKRWALALSERKNRKQAVVALARKMSVLMHRLWVEEEDFRPFAHTDSLAA